ncbi:MAG: hypothetical protein M2R45_04818 [Verrucomicrobia subdivision 3 bacterium]|nr:hypothetical protein [Limisphaerales bacterium]MCS1417293.1 hypothetical protein [Limisphaerales bacterium]
MPARRYWMLPSMDLARCRCGRSFRGRRLNLASIHCYFGSKNALIEEVLYRCLMPLNEERLGGDSVSLRRQVKMGWCLWRMCSMP